MSCAREGVHSRPDGYRQPLRPFDYRCIGPECEKTDHYCVAACPQQALSLSDNPVVRDPGRLPLDARPAGEQLADGRDGPPAETAFGKRNRQFGRRLRPLAVPLSAAVRRRASAARTSPRNCVLNRRNDSRPKITIDVPWYGGGMSFGSTNIRVLLGKARVAKAFHGFTCTGEGGYPERFIPYADHVITQVATGLFGVREETIQRARIVEFKYAQGAKPGLGGHLLGDKNTPGRGGHAGSGRGHLALFALPVPQRLLGRGPQEAPRLDRPRQPAGAAVGQGFHAGATWTWWRWACITRAAHIVHLDGSYGGTGAAPNIAKKNIAMPIEYAINRVHQFLVDEGIREQITVIASGGIRTPADMAKAIAMGADGVVIGTAELVAVGCIRCGCCESGRGCARGIATTDPELLEMVTVEWCTQRLVNLYTAWRQVLVEYLYRLGLDSVAALRGRTDLLTHLDYEES